MTSASPVTEWTQGHSGARDVGRLIAEQGEVTRTGPGSREADDIQRAGPARPEPIGAFGGLARLLAVMIREPHEGPRDHGRYRAHAERLVETIRALSAL